MSKAAEKKSGLTVSNTTTSQSNAPWNTAVVQAIQSADAEQLRQIIAQLKLTTAAAQAKLLTVSNKVEDCIVLVDSNQTQDQDLSFNRNSRSVVSTFAIGPNRVAFSLSVANIYTEGSEDVTVECDLFLIEEEEFECPSKANLREYLESTGISDFSTSRYNGTDKDLEMYWYFGDVVSHCIGLLLEKYGETDEYGVSLGFGKEQIYELLEKHKDSFE